VTPPSPSTDALIARILEVVERYPHRKSAILPALHLAQEHYGWLPPEAFEIVGEALECTPAFAQSVASFYDMFEHHPVGRHTIYVCTNISCSMRGADRVYEALQDAAGDDVDFNVRSFECLGACDIAPMASVNSIYVGPLTLQDCPTLIEQLRNGEEPMPHKRLVGVPIARTWWASGEHPEGEPAGGAGAEGSTAIGNE